MKKNLPLCFFVVLIAACNSSEKDTPMRNEPEKNVPVQALIDNTPVTVLPIGGSIRALQTHADLSNPENAVWREAQEYSMQLGLAPPVHPSINLRYDANTAPVPVFLRAASDGNNLYLRMRWADDSENTATSHEDFADGAAVQFALGDVATTSFMMGAANDPVNIWYWKAGQPQAQNLAAGGFGSTTRLEAANLSASSVYRSSGEWLVVFSRPLQQGGEHQIALANDTAHMSFALWQGEQKQRDGLKHVSMGWVELQLANTESTL